SPRSKTKRRQVMIAARNRTPANVALVAAELMGGIDCRPETHSQEWRGRVFAVIQYARGLTAKWVRKLIDSHKSGHVGSAVAIVPFRPDTEWCSLLSPYLICCVTGTMRITSKGAAPFPSAIVNLGNDNQKFADAFSAWGIVYNCAFRRKVNQ